MDETLAIRADGSLWGWGQNGGGQLGNGTRSSRLSLVPLFSTWKEVAVNMSHSLGIRADGSLWAWGNNRNGQLGVGTTTQHLRPVRVLAGF
jgi:alpha-tubulin suppressor-like RCC1 family protein